MNTEPENQVSPVEKKKRFPVWLAIVLVLILFTGGVLVGLKLSVYPEPVAFFTKLFPNVDVSTEIVFASPTPEAVKETDKPVSTPTSKPVASPRPTPNAKQENATMPVESTPGAVKDKEQSVKTEPQYITVDEALKIVFEHAGVNEKDANVYSMHRERDDGIVYYEVKFAVDNKNYEYDINAVTAQIEGWEIRTEERLYTTSPAVPSSPSPEPRKTPELIDEQTAKLAAFKHCGVSEADVHHVRVSLDLKGVNTVYEVDFYCAGYEYEYDIDAITGDVVSYEKSID